MEIKVFVENEDMGLDLYGDATFLDQDIRALIEYDDFFMFEVNGSWHRSKDMSKVETIQDIIYENGQYITFNSDFEGDDKPE